MLRPELSSDDRVDRSIPTGFSPMYTKIIHMNMSVFSAELPQAPPTMQ